MEEFFDLFGEEVVFAGLSSRLGSNFLSSAALAQASRCFCRLRFSGQGLDQPSKRFRIAAQFRMLR